MSKLYLIHSSASSNELYHYGIKGQKRGVRRFQYEDGSLTPAGRDRYGIGERIRAKFNDIRADRRRRNLNKSSKRKSNIFTREIERNKRRKKYVERIVDTQGAKGVRRFTAKNVIGIHRLPQNAFYNLGQINTNILADTVMGSNLSPSIKIGADITRNIINTGLRGMQQYGRVRDYVATGYAWWYYINNKKES